MSTFEQLYRKITTRANYIEPKYPRMDNWSVDRYEADNGLIAGMSDSGYCRWVGKMEQGKVIWKVSDNYPRPLEYSGITPEQFAAIEE